MKDKISCRRVTESLQQTSRKLTERSEKGKH